jgi:hypothetical protein
MVPYEALERPLPIRSLPATTTLQPTRLKTTLLNMARSQSVMELRRNGKSRTERVNWQIDLQYLFHFAHSGDKLNQGRVVHA